MYRYRCLLDSRRTVGEVVSLVPIPRAQQTSGEIPVLVCVPCVSRLPPVFSRYQEDAADHSL